MKCPSCSAEFPASSHGCPSCEAALAKTVAVAVLTPPPVGAPTKIAPARVVDTTGLPSAPVRDRYVDAATVVSAGALGTTDTSAATVFPPHESDATVRTGQSGPLSPPAPSDGGPLQPGKPFGSRYHIIRMLGLGGMGAVYQAWDEELSVAVAIKVIRPDAMEDRAATREIERRFKRELLLARQVTHKNVVRIHDIGEIDGIKYITMSYIDGTDLASILKREGKLPVAKALVVLRSFIPGLVAAHTAGVAHLDLKPANIMIGKKGDALIMDFGIARSITGRDIEPDGGPAALPEEFRRAATGDAEATMAGSILGTIHYMAPEQAKSRDVDQRADIYAVGLIVYDMLLGRRRAELAESAMGELEARMTQAPPAVKSVAADIPAAVDAIVSRCLDPDPAKRFQTSVDLVAALDALDENGEPLPVRRVVGLPLMAAVVVVLVGLGSGAWYYQRQFIPPPVHDPVSVVIADFQNRTSDPAFERTLEPMLKLALEGASFISAYSRAEISRNLGVPPPETLDEAAARELAVKQGLGVVLSGSVDRDGTGYRLTVKAAQAVTGEVITTSDDRASSKDQVLAVATALATEVREALGDETTSDSAQRFGMDRLSATSLEVVREYAAAMQAMSDGKFEDARQRYAAAATLDPNFGFAYAGMGIATRNLGRQQDAEKYAAEAVRHLDGMTERERFRTRGLYYLITSDYQACAKEYGDLIVLYPADTVGHNNLALCSTYLRDMAKALSEMRRVVGILPKRALYRVNLALYAAYASDFQTAEREAQTARDLGNTLGLLPLAFAYVGEGQVAKATDTYQALEKIGAQGASWAASGLGDLAAYEGRFSDAIRILEDGAAADVKASTPDKAAAKLVAVAYARLSKGETRAAIAAADRALAQSQSVKIRFLAARVFIEAGQLARARSLGAELSSGLQVEPQAYGKIIEGQAARKSGDLRASVTALTDANTLLDTWIGRFELGRAYLDAGAFTQADSEFDRCLKRRGEAVSVFVDEEPTSGFLPPVYYYQGRVREGLKSVGFAESYRAYLNIRGKAVDDPLLADVRRRAGG